LQVHNWQCIAEEHASAVWQTAYRLLRNHADAADCFQEAFLAAFELSQRQSVRNVRALLLHLATTRAIDQLRRRMRQSRHEANDDDVEAVSARPGPDVVVQNLELAERLRAAIAQLPPQEAKVFCLRYFNDLSYRQIAGELTITSGAVGVLLHRAKGKLRHLLEPVEAEETRLPYGT
jgi:RNA polymerase sigma-70 factor (ECF subfamily)